jgi:DNA-binding Lrp family transcriptional regulator
MATIVDQKYTPTEIIKKDLARGGFTKEEDKLLKGFVALINAKKAVLVRHNNTVFVGIRKEPGVLEVHMYTLDPLAMLPEAMKVAFDSVKKAGVKKLQSETTNPRLIKMLETLGPVKTTKKGNKIAWELEIAK